MSPIRTARRSLVTTALGVLAATTLACSGPSEPKATPSAPAPAATTVAAASASANPIEVDHVKSAKPKVDALVAALKKNDLPASLAAYEQYDALWNGVEVYVNFRSRELYGALETDLQAKIADGLAAKTPNLAAVVPNAEALARRYDEAIALVQKGPALSPLFDDLATLRLVRSDLRIVTAAVGANDLAKAKASFATFQSNFAKADPLIKQRSTTAAADVADALAKADAAFKAPGATADSVKPLVAALTDRYNFGVNLLNAAARNADLKKTGVVEADVAALTALNDIAVSLAKSQAAWTAGTYAAAGDAARAATGAQFEKVKPVLQPKAADAALKTALDNYEKVAGAAGDAAKVRAANQAARDAVAVAQQAVAGQFWTDAKLQSTLAALPKA